MSTGDDLEYKPLLGSPELARDVKTWLARLASAPALLGTWFLMEALRIDEGLAMIGISIIATACFALALTMLVGSLAMHDGR